MLTYTKLAQLENALQPPFTSKSIVIHSCNSVKLLSSICNTISTWDLTYLKVAAIEQLIMGKYFLLLLAQNKSDMFTLTPYQQSLPTSRLSVNTNKVTGSPLPLNSSETSTASIRLINLRWADSKFGWKNQQQKYQTKSLIFQHNLNKFSLHLRWNYDCTWVLWRFSTMKKMLIQLSHSTLPL